nr:KilA-N domain-containing protein [Escherichia coli]
MNISNLHQNVDPSTTLPVICGVEITTDRAGRYNLNALHRASGLGAHKAPAQWLRTLSAKQLIEELEKETMQNCIVSFEGRGGGTFAHECSQWSTLVGFSRVSAEGKPDIYRLSSWKITTCYSEEPPRSSPFGC